MKHNWENIGANGVYNTFVCKTCMGVGRKYDALKPMRLQNELTADCVDAYWFTTIAKERHTLMMSEIRIRLKLLREDEEKKRKAQRDVYKILDSAQKIGLQFSLYGIQAEIKTLTMLQKLGTLK